MTNRRGRGEPRPITDSLAELGGELGLADPRATRRLVESWPELVGAGVAEHAWPLQVRNRVLTIAVDDPAWAAELRYQERTVRDRIVEHVGTDVVRALRVVVRPR